MSEQRRVPSQVLMIVPCNVHVEVVVKALDEARMRDWVIVPGAQGRRKGFLEFAPRRHEETCDVVFGMAEAPVVAETLNRMLAAISGHELCPNCLAYTWPATQVVLAEVALDPVCLMVVNRDQALSAAHAGATYYFCSDNCRERFIHDPRAWVREAVSAEQTD